MKEVFTQLLRSIKKMPLRTLLAAFVIMNLQNKAFAQPVNIVVNPSTSNVLLNQDFNVDVTADFTASGTLNVIEAYVNFNPADLMVVSTNIPSSTITLLPGESVPMTVNNTTGRVDHGRFISSPSNHPNNDFVLFTITFRALRVPPGGFTNVSFNTTNPRRSIALEGATIVSNQYLGGVVNIQDCTPPTASIATSSSATICNGQPVGLRLESATGSSPFSLTVNGTQYDNVLVGSTFATIPFPTHKIWPSTNPTGGGAITQNDGSAIETGTKFYSSQAGFIKGVRFYHGTSSSHPIAGTYKGKLWNFNTGTLMGSVTFSSVTQGAWQEVLFSTPIPVAANTTYLVTMYSSAGNYVATDGYFSSSITSGPLTAPSNSTATNGIYFFGAEQTGPSTNFNSWSSYLSTNYWVDVLFSPNSASFDLTTVVDGNGCNNTGALQTLNVLSVSCASLPVTLLNLSALPGSNKITLRWSTSSEINNKGFEVQRSTEGSDWATIGFVNGAGNSSSTKNYNYADVNVEARKYYYRLKQVDIDDRYKYSAIVSATLNGKNDYALGQSYPNPTRGQVTIQFTLPQSEQVNLSLYDMNGRLVKTILNASKEAGTHAINFNVSALSRGLYFYKIQAGYFTDVKKLTVQ